MRVLRSIVGAQSLLVQFRETIFAKRRSQAEAENSCAIGCVPFRGYLRKHGRGRGWLTPALVFDMRIAQEQGLRHFCQDRGCPCKH
jgi:hypothetical protein